MRTGTKVALATLGVVGGGLLANALFKASDHAKTRAQNPMPRGALGGGVSVGARSPGAGTHDWWLDRNDRRKKKHLRMMTAKG